MKRITEPQAIIWGAIIGGIFVIGAALLTLWPHEDKTTLLLPGIPSPTPKPTVIGTPLVGADLAAGGGIGFTVMANDISLVVDEVRAYEVPTQELASVAGYVLVVVNARVSNASQYMITSFDLRLVDDFDNEYKNWGALASRFGATEFPSSIGYGESGGGSLVYRVPSPALANSLRLRLEPRLSPFEEPTTRLEIFFDPVVAIESP